MEGWGQLSDITSMGRREAGPLGWGWQGSKVHSGKVTWTVSVTAMQSWGGGGRGQKCTVGK